MLNYIWPIFIIISFIFGVCFGNIEDINDSIFKSTGDAVNLSIKLLGTICLWNGIMNIAQHTSIIRVLKKIIKPIFKVLFPKITENDEVYSQMSVNVIANIMGLRKCFYTCRFKSNATITKKEW